jgi:antitoxin component YwqK of YwqJK toxin-antitoxin module
MHGLKQIKNEDDEIIEQATYVDGRVHGELIFKTKNGSYTESNFVNGQREGIFKVYYPIHPKHGKVLYLETVCKNGAINGEVKKYHMNGKLCEEYNMQEGLIVGKALYYDPEGNLAREALFANGVLDGELKDFFKDGSLQKIISVKNGLPEGEEISYFHDGKIQHVKEYHEGKLHGFSKSYNENGVLIFEAQYKEGLKHGIFNKYYDDGRAKLFQFYDGDKQVDRKAFAP